MQIYVTMQDRTDCQVAVPPAARLFRDRWRNLESLALDGKGKQYGKKWRSPGNFADSVKGINRNLHTLSARIIFIEKSHTRE